jgi:LytS/YehU family sensor histidine kinase
MPDFRPRDMPRMPDRPRHSVISMFLFNRKIYLFFLVIVGTILIKTRNRLKAIEKEKAITELSFLKAQINPHFLFNTLNSIYSLSLQKSDAAPGAVVKLSGMMRYVLQEAQQNEVPLESEINYIKDFIELQKLRLDESVKLKFEVNGSITQKKIAPLILMSFIENAFKYGVNSEMNSEIEIAVNTDGNWLFLYVRNNKVQTTLANTSNTRLGLINTKKRLDLIYPGAYILDIQDKEKEFLVNLKIQLHD